MKRTLVTIVVGLAAVVGAEAQDRAASLGVDVAPLSKYVWRGIPLTDGPVLQLSYTLAAKGVGFNIWQNVDLDDANGSPGLVTEHDYTLSCEFTAGKATVSLGVLYYSFPFTSGDPTTEIIAGASFDVAASPSVVLYQDVESLHGLYATLGASHGISLGRPSEQTLDLGLTVGFGTDKHNSQYGAGVAKSAFTDILFTVSSTFKVDESFSITPSVVVAAALDTDIADALDAAGQETSHVAFGVTLSYAF